MLTFETFLSHQAQSFESFHWFVGGSTFPRVTGGGWRVMGSGWRVEGQAVKNKEKEKGETKKEK